MTTDNIFIDELGHVLRVGRIDSSSFHPSTEIVPSKNNKPNSRCWRHIDDIHSNVCPYHDHPSRLQRFFMPISSTALAFLARFDIFGHIFIESLLLIMMMYLL